MMFLLLSVSRSVSQTGRLGKTCGAGVQDFSGLYEAAAAGFAPHQSELLIDNLSEYREIFFEDVATSSRQPSLLAHSLVSEVGYDDHPGVGVGSQDPPSCLD